ncbi:MAG TPA: AAA family ATPase, partial [Methanothrix soehngenii]|nr:AAA family ATPase [Methanothrix soehngenii]
MGEGGERGGEGGRCPIKCHIENNNKDYIFPIGICHWEFMMIIQSIAFENYMAYKRFSLALTQFNILVGPNNSGKSTIIKSLQLLEAAWRSGIKRNPSYINEIDKYG